MRGEESHQQLGLAAGQLDDGRRLRERDPRDHRVQAGIGDRPEDAAADVGERREPARVAGRRQRGQRVELSAWLEPAGFRPDRGDPGSSESPSSGCVDGFSSIRVTRTLPTRRPSVDSTVRRSPSTSIVSPATGTPPIRW